jgi:hypothetical protein
MIYDIIIIGGGIAGLYAGIECLKAHPEYNIILLEKYNYIGGRVVSYKKTLDGIGTVGWENGAGRINIKHTIVKGLIHQYGLHTIPIDDAVDFYDKSGGASSRSQFEDLIRIYLQPLSLLSPKVLGEHTLYTLCKEIYGIKETQALFARFPYYTEVHVLRADVALNQFLNGGDMSTNAGYVVCKEGLSALIAAMEADFKGRGGKIQTGYTVKNITAVRGSKQLAVTGEKQEQLAGNRVISTLHVNAAKQLPVFRSWAPLKHLRMMPLLRIYMVFPKGAGGQVWFKGIGKIVTTNALRYIIPMDAKKGSIMISYTDGAYVQPWMKGAEYGASTPSVEGATVLRMQDSKKASADLQRRIMKEVRELFGDRDIPDPVFMKCHPWYDGTTAWLPGSYNVAATAAAVCRGPLPGLYVTGESYSLRQAWMEGALEHVKMMLTELKL